MNIMQSPNTGVGRKLSEKEQFEIFDGMEEVNRKMAEKIEEEAPICHFTKMSLEFGGDYFNGSYDEWWECRHCGHTKPK
jgi:hypothetical protein